MRGQKSGMSFVVVMVATTAAAAGEVTAQMLDDHYAAISTDRGSYRAPPIKVTVVETVDYYINCSLYSF